MPDLKNLLDQIDRLDQEATPGPWYQGQEKMYESPVDVFATRDPEDPDAQDIATYMHSENDAEFIALARTALPQLAKALRAVIESCEETIRSVDKNLLPDERDHAFRDHADMVLDQITDAMEGDDGDV